MMTTSEFQLTGSDVFGRYCRIEMKRFGAPNEFYVHKCIRSYRSNYYRDVPLMFGEGEYVHPGRCVDVVSVITCGLDEKEVFNVPLDSIEFVEPQERTCHMENIDTEPGGYQGIGDCSECGEMLLPSFAFCPRCGARVVTNGGEG